MLSITTRTPSDSTTKFQVKTKRLEFSKMDFTIFIKTVIVIS